MFWTPGNQQIPGLVMGEPRFGLFWMTCFLCLFNCVLVCLFLFGSGGENPFTIVTGSFVGFKPRSPKLSRPRALPGSLEGATRRLAKGLQGHRALHSQDPGHFWVWPIQIDKQTHKAMDSGTRLQGFASICALVKFHCRSNPGVLDMFTYSYFLFLPHPLFRTGCGSNEHTLSGLEPRKNPGRLTDITCARDASHRPSPCGGFWAGRLTLYIYNYT